MNQVHAIIVPEALRAHANLAASQIGIDPEGTLNTLSVALVPAAGPDDAEPTHWACCGQLPDEAREYLGTNLSEFPGAMWWRWQADRRLVSSHETRDLGKFWDWDNCLQRAGLKVQVKESRPYL